MSVPHLRIAFRDREGYWWFPPQCLQELEAAINGGGEWVSLRDVGGGMTYLRVADITAFYLWTPESYTREREIADKVRDFCEGDEPDDLLPGDEWKRA